MLNVTAIGITVEYGYSGQYGWVATLHWQDDKFCQEGAVEGKICTRYFEKSLGSAIDCVIEVAEQFGIPLFSKFSLFYENDGEGVEVAPPSNWREILYQEAQKRGWRTYPRQDGGPGE